MSERSRLRWRCRRGMKELDLLLLSYLERRYDAASEEERWIFSELLELPDPKLHAYLLGREQPAVQLPMLSAPSGTLWIVELGQDG